MCEESVYVSTILQSLMPEQHFTASKLTQVLQCDQLSGKNWPVHQQRGMTTYSICSMKLKWKAFALLAQKLLSELNALRVLLTRSWKKLERREVQTGNRSPSKEALRPLLKSPWTRLSTLSSVSVSLSDSLITFLFLCDAAVAVLCCCHLTTTVGYRCESELIHRLRTEKSESQ